MVEEKDKQSGREDKGSWLTYPLKIMIKEKEFVHLKFHFLHVYFDYIIISD